MRACELPQTLRELTVRTHIQCNKCPQSKVGLAVRRRLLSRLAIMLIRKLLRYFLDFLTKRSPSTQLRLDVRKLGIHRQQRLIGILQS